MYGDTPARHGRERPGVYSDLREARFSQSRHFAEGVARARDACREPADGSADGRSRHGLSAASGRHGSGRRRICARQSHGGNRRRCWPKASAIRSACLFRKTRSTNSRSATISCRRSDLRKTKVEFIACPSCGRTKFELTTVLRQVKAATKHLVGLDIAVMGCIVNGPARWRMPTTAMSARAGE